MGRNGSFCRHWIGVCTVAEADNEGKGKGAVMGGWIEVTMAVEVASREISAILGGEGCSACTRYILLLHLGCNCSIQY